jgi:hypothetical protein
VGRFSQGVCQSVQEREETVRWHPIRSWCSPTAISTRP